LIKIKIYISESLKHNIFQCVAEYKSIPKQFGIKTRRPLKWWEEASQKGDAAKEEHFKVARIFEKKMLTAMTRIQT
jgi:transposase-like protein